MNRGYIGFLPALVLLSSLACGGPTAPTNPPVANLTISPQGSVIVGITTVTFQAAPDALAQTSYSWNFGDGAAAAGATAIHVYTREGTFSVVLTATNTGGSAIAAAAITARSLTGVWRPDFFFAPCFSVRLTHNGSNVDAIAINGSAASATVQSPRDITLTIAPTPAQNCGSAIQNRSGTFDATLDSFTLTITPTQTDTWRRQ